MEIVASVLGKGHLACIRIAGLARDGLQGGVEGRMRGCTVTVAPTNIQSGLQRTGVERDRPPTQPATTGDDRKRRIQIWDRFVPLIP